MNNEQRLIASTFIPKVIASILDGDVRRATKYISPKLVVRAVLQTFKIHGRRPRKGENIQITLTIGRPNYKERDFIKDCKEAKEPFPVKGVIIELIPSKE